jgi:uncharacterized membrane protein YccC
MLKRIIGAIIGMIIGFVIFKIFFQLVRDPELLETIWLLLGGLLVAYITGGSKPKS